jgi:membrane-bound lytic murein transglycosylase B
VAHAPRPYVQAAERWGFLADAQAHKYGLPNGATLLLKIASGESGFNMGAKSSAGARGATQFIASTREEWIRKYHVDPWKSPDEAIHATAIFMHTLGLAHYNSGGGQEYIDYILKQPVSAAEGAGRRGARGRGAGAKGEASSSSSSAPNGFGGALMEFGLVGLFVLGGAAMVGLGATRMLGTAKGGA